jgi:SAM-dependent methyltransferase
MGLYRRAQRVFASHGIAGTLRLVAEKARHGSARAIEPPDPFDADYGVTTVGKDEPTDLRIASPNVRYGHRPEPTKPAHFYRMMAAVAERIPGATFMDIGCGRGRAILLAAGYAFIAVEGVEYAADLVEVAQRNLITYAGPLVCRTLRVQCADATEVRLPLTPLVLFLYNPFSAPVMQRFVAHVERSLAEHPRPCTVVYHIPECAEAWDQSPAFQRVHDGSLFTVWVQT